MRAFVSPLMHCSPRGLLLCLSNRSSTSGTTKGRDSRAAIFSPDTHNEQTDGENDEDRDNNNAVQNVWELTDEQAAANLQELVHQVAALPPMQPL